MSRIDRIRAKLARDRKRGWIGGVCAGCARHFHIDPAFVRVGFVVVAIFSWKVALAVYAVAWILLPSRDGAAPPPLA